MANWPDDYSEITLATGDQIPVHDVDGDAFGWTNVADLVAQVDAASETVAGKVELATNAEVTTGSDTARAVTPAGLHQKTASTTAIGLVELATTAEATAASDTARAVTPAGLADRVLTSRTISTTAPLSGGGDLSANRTLTVGAASDTATGVVELATNAETQTGSDTARAVTPAGLHSKTASTTAIGLVELATTAEATAQSDTARAVTPAGLADRVLNTRTISTTAPLSGGGDLSANRTLTVGAASETATGVVELATSAETTTGSDNTRAVHPAGLAAQGYLPKVAAGAAVENLGAVEFNVNTVATSGSTETLDTSVYAVHDVTMDQNCTFTFSNPAPSGKLSEFTLILRGAFTPTLPASVDWAGGTPPTYTTPSKYVFSTVNAGTTWLGSLVGSAFG